MVTPALEQIAALLTGISGPGSFAACRSASADDLHLAVTGIGPLRFPISRAQAQQLCRVARPARYGRGEETLLDRRVRDTWEVPRSRVKIDRRRWNRTLLPVLDQLRGDLGLPEACRLKAELHSMLVYGPGQFFRTHQDSEKTDHMVGTLVVTLPSRFKGGALVVEHQGEKVSYGASRQPLSLVAFYADCHHEVRPVKQGFRIALSYNLMLEPGRATAALARAAGGPATDSGTVEALAELVRRHFTTPAPSRSAWNADAPGQQPPSRLVYLLDHQYTERGLGWQRLKGDDIARVAALRAAAARAGCDIVLALAEIHETWGCEEEGWYGYEEWSPRSRRWERDEEGDWYADDDPPPDDPDWYTLTDLQDRSITLVRWIDPTGRKGDPIVTYVRDEEACCTTPTVDLEPYASEYEGYMGNYGNTMDRWYRRAAVVLWPRSRAFTVRAEASPGWALETLKQRIRTGAIPEARKLAASLRPFWGAGPMREAPRGVFDQALRVADGLDEPELAAFLLQPFGVEWLTPRRAPAFEALVARYGEEWGRSLLGRWSASHRRWRQSLPEERMTWLASLPRLCEALRAAGDGEATPAARLLVEDQWGWLRETIEATRGLVPPSHRDEALDALTRPILGFLGGSALAKSEDVHREALTFLCAGENEPLLPCLMQVVRAAASMAPESRLALSVGALERHCARLLERRLSVPARADDDWSIALPGGCRCQLCRTLAGFLAAPDRRRFEWPLAKEGRRHVHQRLDTHELPVLHETRRSGRPFTLVLTKTKALFDREANERRRWQADLDWLGTQKRRH